MSTNENSKNALQAGTILTSPNQTYIIRRVLGRGGFGITYLAECQVMMGNISRPFPVCIKEFFPKDAGERMSDTSTMTYSNAIKDKVQIALKDFMGEARRLSALAGKHANIVAVNEVFEANNTAYYVMEYLEGSTLQTLIDKNGALSQDKMLSIMTPIVDAVAFLHREHLTHLDIKPANIMIVDTADGKQRPVLIDFGLSKHYNDDGSATSTIAQGGFSEGFSPREQYGLIKTFTPTADVYAIGATMLYCLTAKRLESSLTLTDEDIVNAIPTTVSPKLHDALIGALALHHKNRTADAGALLSTLPSIKADTDNDTKTKLITNNKRTKNDEISKVNPDIPVVNNEQGNNKRTILNKPLVLCMIGVIVAAVAFIVVYLLVNTKSSVDDEYDDHDYETMDDGEYNTGYYDYNDPVAYSSDTTEYAYPTEEVEAIDTTYYVEEVPAEAVAY